jgi:hypothetical protein
MCCMPFTMSPSSRKAVECQLKIAQHLGHLCQVKYFLAILAVMDGQSCAHGAMVLRVHEKTVAAWVCAFCQRALLLSGEGRLNAAAYLTFLQRVLEQTTQYSILIEQLWKKIKQ